MIAAVCVHARVVVKKATPHRRVVCLMDVTHRGQEGGGGCFVVIGRMQDYMSHYRASGACTARTKNHEFYPTVRSRILLRGEAPRQKTCCISEVAVPERFSRPPGVCATVATVPDVNRTGRRGA